MKFQSNNGGGYRDIAKTSVKFLSRKRPQSELNSSKSYKKLLFQ